MRKKRSQICQAENSTPCQDISGGEKEEDEKTPNR